ncbi:dnaJ homolog subfamily C member 30-like isoform X2 [Mizuhopecten yessoensis]|uniref:dnaJ homolog subfamily C member 30-like isoform X2 n=1 Tax=Mizuhopecten yessoensis TaxID=6573 RepID=UPI000B45E1EE|nr:dnaJ homolog subfamily C member 30-like isoform X2 [Mizuhopecten yessoensis]
MKSLTAAVCGCVTRATTRWHHPKVYSWPSILLIRCSHYDVLGVPKNATQKDIKAAFIDKSKKYHPDRNSNPNAKTIFSKCAEAYEILGKEKSRTDYDASLRPPSNTYRPQQSGHRPDPFQSSSTGYHPRQETAYRGSSSTRNRYRGYEREGWNPYEDVYFQQGHQRRAQSWKEATDKRKAHHMNERDAMAKQKKMWRDIGIFTGVLVVLMQIGSIMKFHSVKKRKERRIQERRELAKLRQQQYEN